MAKDGQHHQTRKALIEEAVQQCQHHFYPNEIPEEYLAGTEEIPCLNVDRVRQELTANGSVELSDGGYGFNVTQASVTHLPVPVLQQPPPTLPVDLRTAHGFQLCITGQLIKPENDMYAPIIQEVRHDFSRKRQQLWTMER
ncbi:expressed unknown protein [Seminavis robusta]|uniref:Uncharacterized protein n=1 Tax=Seminavis robusta TaxID=568900 RepID=A0A9N8DEP9_9STRA|nr:expressed unknown protein [Seminavis robusta]|eukprot:Sro59_g034330.1 n/a (141) ;mRNA; f:120805-121227